MFHNFERWQSTFIISVTMNLTPPTTSSERKGDAKLHSIEAQHSASLTMKKVSVSKQTVFDDPLFNPGDSFKTRDSDECTPASHVYPQPELVNTLTLSDEESLLTSTKPMKTSKPKVSPVIVKDEVKAFPPKADAPKVAKVADVLKDTSLNDTRDSEGEDLFLPTACQKKKVESNFEEELFGQAVSSPSELQNLRLGGSDNDNEIRDLQVGAIMEREELDFDMFGKSSVRQYEPGSTQDSNSSKGLKDVASALSKDDLVLESGDVLSDYETLLADNSHPKTLQASTSSSVSQARSNDATKSVVVNDSYDIDAYISQQEEDGGGLFD